MIKFFHYIMADTSSSMNGIYTALANFGMNALSASIDKADQYYFWKKQFLYAKNENRAIQQENWDRYLSPTAQMRAYEEAGLNPNLIYGQAVSSPVQQMQSPQSISSRISPTDIGAAMLQLSQVKSNELSQERADRLANAQIAKTMQDIEESKSRIATNSTNQNLTNLRSVYQDLLNQYYNETRTDEKALLASRIKFIDNQIQHNLFMEGLASERLNFDMHRLQVMREQFQKSLDVELQKFEFDKTYKSNYLKFLQSPGAANNWFGALTRALYSGTPPNFDVLRNDGMRKQGIYFSAP